MVGQQNVDIADVLQLICYGKHLLAFCICGAHWRHPVNTAELSVVRVWRRCVLMSNYLTTGYYSKNRKWLPSVQKCVFMTYTRSLQKLSFIDHIEVVLSIVSDIWRDICRKSNFFPTQLVFTLRQARLILRWVTVRGYAGLSM